MLAEHGCAHRLLGEGSLSSGQADVKAIPPGTVTDTVRSASLLTDRLSLGLLWAILSPVL